VRNGLPSMLSVYECRNVFHWSRAVESVHRNEILELVGLELAEVFLHPRAFKLKCPGSFAALEQFVSFRVVERDFVNIDVDVSALLDIFYRRLDDGQSRQSEEVHL